MGCLGLACHVSTWPVTYLLYNYYQQKRDSLQSGNVTQESKSVTAGNQAET